MILALLVACVAQRGATAADWQLCGTALSPPPKPEPEAADPDSETIDASAERGELVEGEQSMLAGEVHIRRGSTQMRADTVTLDEPARTLGADGDVEFWDDNLFLTGSTARLALDTDETQIENGEFIVTDEHGRGTGQAITIAGNDFIYSKETTYTTCNPGSNIWQVSAETLTLDKKNDVGRAFGAWLELGGVPVFYSPYLSFPLSDKRKSGLLTPAFRLSGSSGFEITTPYYFNLAPNQDATFGVRTMTARGVQLQGEYRYLTPRSHGTLGVEYLPYDTRLEEDRTALRYRHAATLAPRWSTDVDIDWVSDATYFEDLGSGLAISSQTHLIQRAELQYTGTGFRAIGRVQDYTTVDRTIPSTSRPYKRLPQLLLNTTLSEKNRRLNFAFDGEIVNFERRDRVTGTRIDVEPSVRLPLRAASGFVIPKLGLRLTHYYLDGRAAGEDDQPNRLLPLFSTDSGLYFDRPLSFRGEAYVHTLEPRAFYLYVPFDRQDALPVFDTGRFDFNFARLFAENRFSGPDRVGDANQIALSLTSRLLGQSSGEELIRGSVGVIRHFRDRKVTLPARSIETTTTSDYVAEVSARLAAGFRASAGLQWNPDRDRAEKRALSLRYQPDARRVINLGYRFVRDDIDQTDVSIAWPLSNQWRAVGRWNYSLREGATLEVFGGLEYESCCWGFRTVIRRYLSDTEGDNTNAIFFQLELKGLSGLGSDLTGFLRRNIPGYLNEF